MQEDKDLAKIMDFMLAVSILLALTNIYWYGYEGFQQWNLTVGILDKILNNFANTTGLFNSIVWSKLFCVIMLALSCTKTR